MLTITFTRLKTTTKNATCGSSRQAHHTAGKQWFYWWRVSLWLAADCFVIRNLKLNSVVVAKHLIFSRDASDVTLPISWSLIQFQTELSQQLLNGLPWNSVQMFMIPRRGILLILVIPHHREVAICGFKVKYLNNYLMDCIWFRILVCDQIPAKNNDFPSAWAVLSGAD